MAEACLLQVGGGRLKGFSCGVPGSVSNKPDERAMAAMHQAGLHTRGLHCKSWTEFMRSGAPRLRFVISLDATVDSPPWPGQPETATWTFADRAIVGEAGTADDVVTQLYLRDLYLLRRRLEILVNLPLHGVDQASLRGDLRDLAYLG